jgi:ferrochelatase
MCATATGAPGRRRLCVFLLQLGAPADRAGIEPFLRNLFEDVLPVPGFVRPLLARLIARRRAPAVWPLYQRLGGGSPLRANTEAQAQALEQRLLEEGFNARVLVCMRYAPPRAAEALEEARRDWSDALWVVLPLYPQYSFTTTRSSIDELVAGMTTPEQERLLTVNAYPEDPAYLEVMTDCVRDAIEQIPAEERERTPVLFSAHSLPLKVVKAGDPYPTHVEQTVAGIVARLEPRPAAHLAFQSRVGPVRWLTPSTIDTVTALGAAGTKSLVVVPVAFVSEHLETLYELDVELREVARAAGITRFVRASTPGTRPAFIGALARLVIHALPRESLQAIPPDWSATT